MRSLLQDNYSESQSNSFSTCKFTIQNKFSTEQSKAIFAIAFDYTIAKFLCQGDDEFTISEEQKTLDTALTYTPAAASGEDNISYRIHHNCQLQRQFLHQSIY